MISSQWRPYIALATQVLEFCKVLDLLYRVLESKAAESPRRQEVQMGSKVVLVNKKSSVYLPKVSNFLFNALGVTGQCRTNASNRAAGGQIGHTVDGIN